MSTLTIDNLSFGGRGPYAFSVPGGQCLGLTGVSGAGKSLLLRAIADLDPHEGTVRLGDLECAAVPAPRWRRTVALLPAESSWWLDTVSEHFRDFDGVPEQDLESLGFRRETGTWQISRLSTGEKQRLAVLRLLENRPGALLLDEPTASLDAASIRRVEELLLDYGRRNEAPLLWVSHDSGQLDRVAGARLDMRPDGTLESPGGDHGR